jgi:ribosomal protein L16 Arg81 hydroxylase|tara:strand:- start:892 stop:1137 length:246 start_codon:yes stop_codon:yes gene_type:complete
MPRKKPNKFLKINGKVVTLPKKALGNGSKNPIFPNGKNTEVDPFKQRQAAEDLAKEFLKAKEQGLDVGDKNLPRHLRKIAE